MGSIIFGGLLARRGAGACLLWLLAGRGAGRWGVLAVGSPARRLLLAWSRRVCCCATFRSLPSVGQRFSRARPDRCLPR